MPQIPRDTCRVHSAIKNQVDRPGDISVHYPPELVLNATTKGFAMRNHCAKVSVSFGHAIGQQYKIIAVSVGDTKQPLNKQRNYLLTINYLQQPQGEEETARNGIIIHLEIIFKNKNHLNQVPKRLFDTKSAKKGEWWPHNKSCHLGSPVPKRLSTGSYLQSIEYFPGARDSSSSHACCSYKQITRSAY